MVEWTTQRREGCGSTYALLALRFACCSLTGTTRMTATATRMVQQQLQNCYLANMFPDIHTEREYAYTQKRNHNGAQIQTGVT